MRRVASGAGAWLAFGFGLGLACLAVSMAAAGAPASAPARPPCPDPAITVRKAARRMLGNAHLANPPAEVGRLQQELPAGPFHMDLTAFVPDRECNGRTTHRRAYDTSDGLWTLVIEMEGDRVVAFQARLKHNKSWLMNQTIEGWTEYPKIIQPDGCA